MKIQIIATSVETKPTAKGSYQQLEVTFKNLTYNKTESKKIMSFGAQGPSFKALVDAQAGSQWDITVTKNTQGYNDWTSATPSNGATESSTPAAAAAKGTAPVRSTYETPEERAQRQVLIVKQSSLSAAVSTLSVGAKSVKPDDVIELAQRYTDWVFGVKDPGPSGFDDLPDFDVPEVE